jgi:gliding motility-associated-like protein
MSPSYEFSHAGEYVVQLEVLNENGQIITELSRNICIGGAPAWKIDANYFTPNGDGFSDVFDPAGQSENIIVTGLFIYNYQNQLIFSKTDGDLIWNGSDEYGNPMPDGQYLYRITGVDACDGKVEDKTGTMALRR